MDHECSKYGYSEEYNGTCDTSQTIEEFMQLGPEEYVICLEYVYELGYIWVYPGLGSTTVV